MRKIHLPYDYTLVLRAVEKHGGDYFNNLVESLKFDQGRLMHILRTLQHKRFIKMSWKTHETFIVLTRRGERLARNTWRQPSLA